MSSNKMRLCILGFGAVGQGLAKVVQMKHDELIERYNLDLVITAISDRSGAAINPDGLESFYIYVDRNNRVINDIDRWTKFAKENNLFITIGSDFHQDDGIRPVVGLINVLRDEDLPDTNKILEDLNKK